MKTLIFSFHVSFWRGYLSPLTSWWVGVFATSLGVPNLSFQTILKLMNFIISTVQLCLQVKKGVPKELKVPSFIMFYYAEHWWLDVVWAKNNYIMIECWLSKPGCKIILWRCDGMEMFCCQPFFGLSSYHSVVYN